MVVLMLFKPDGEVVEHELRDISEAFALLDPSFTVELRHGTSCFTSGVKLVPNQELVEYGFEQIAEPFGFVFSNGHHKLIPASTIEKIFQVITVPYQKPEWRSK